LLGTIIKIMSSSFDSGSSFEQPPVPHIITIEIPSSSDLDYTTHSPSLMSDIHLRTMSTSSMSSSRSSILYSPLNGDPPATIKLNVKFAPLPKPDPRKRRSTIPLGVANRGRLVRRRQLATDEDGNPIQQYQSPFWTVDEAREHMQAGTNLVVVEDLGLEDPFIALGKLMRTASRKVWRKVSKKKEKGDHLDTQDEDCDPPKAESSVGESNIQGRGTVSEEEIEGEKQSIKTVGQTETIRDGGQFVWPEEEYPRTENDIDGQISNSES
jgi:hypothetical protein